MRLEAPSPIGIDRCSVDAMGSNLILEIKNGVAHLTLNRPEAANGINLQPPRSSTSCAPRVPTG